MCLEELVQDIEEHRPEIREWRALDQSWEIRMELTWVGSSPSQVSKNIARELEQGRHMGSDLVEKQGNAGVKSIGADGLLHLSQEGRNKREMTASVRETPG